MATIAMEDLPPDPPRRGRVTSCNAYSALERALNLATDGGTPSDWATIAMAMHQMRAGATLRNNRWVVRSVR